MEEQEESQEPIKIEFSREHVELVKTELNYVDSSVDQVDIVHVIEYLTPDQRISFVNELYRILKKGGKVTIITPYWCANRAYGDLAMVWPPVSESWYPQLKEKWRLENNSYEKRYTCNFQPTWGYGMHQLIQPRNQEYQQHAIIFWKESAQDLIATLTKE